LFVTRLLNLRWQRAGRTATLPISACSCRLAVPGQQEQFDANPTQRRMVIEQSGSDQYCGPELSKQHLQ
jgi:hypothetical protein